VAPAAPAQALQPAAAICPPTTRPPAAGSSPVICQTELRFHPINESIIEAQTYLYYIQTPLSRPSEGYWVPFNEETEQTLLNDFTRLGATSFLDNLWIETLDAPFENGVVGKHVIYHMEERPRVKIVDYTGSTKVERTKIDEKMKELGIALRLVFDVKEGPKVKVRTLNFNGNSAISDKAIARQMKSTKAHGMLSWITGKGTYNENKFDEDAEKVIEYYRNKGYIGVRVGQPEIKTLEDSEDKETRWVELNIPVEEGPRYRVGDLKFEGNKIIDAKFILPQFKLKAGDWYSDKPIRAGLVKAREM
jgi:outer membrane protein assembly factor BamA